MESYGLTSRRRASACTAADVAPRVTEAVWTKAARKNELVVLYNGREQSEIRDQSKNVKAPCEDKGTREHADPGNLLRNLGLLVYSVGTR